MKPCVLFFLSLLIISACTTVQDQGTAKRIADSSQRQYPSSTHWLDTFRTADVRDTCAQKLLAQLSMLQAESHSSRFTFDKYPVKATSMANPADLDMTSLPSAKTFKTKLRQALADSGINFAGHYTIADVPMTGWGSNYWIVDRRTGKAWEFPYKPAYIDFRRESNLIILDPKNSILNALKDMDEIHTACVYLHTGDGLTHVDLRPFYLLWQDNKLVQLAPDTFQPRINRFWKDFFGRN